MAWLRKQKQADRENQMLANVSHNRRLQGQGPGHYLANLQTRPYEAPPSFVISGGTPEDRYEAVIPFLRTYLGTMPMVVLHNGGALAEIIQSLWWELPELDRQKLWITGRKNPYFEPFFGMDDMQIVTALRSLAETLHYSATSRFDRIVKAHLQLLRMLKIPVSLTGLGYLCQFEDMGEFHGNVMALPCERNTAMRIWNDLSTDHSDFDLFRAVISALAADAVHSGWRVGNECADVNCLEAIREGATLVMDVDGQHTARLLPYLLEELRGIGNQPFLLLLDNLRINDLQVREYLCDTTTGCVCGVLSDNAVLSVMGSSEGFQNFAERIRCFVIYAHNVAQTATVFSELMGRSEHTIVQVTQGTTQGFWSFLPDSRNESVITSQENRYRVMPEDINGLGPGMAIVFDTRKNLIMLP